MMLLNRVFPTCTYGDSWQYDGKYPGRTVEVGSDAAKKKQGYGQTIISTFFPIQTQYKNWWQRPCKQREDG